MEKIRENVVGGSSIVFTRKAVVGETIIRKSTNVCKSIVGVDARQLYRYSMSQLLPTVLYTRRYLNSETSRFIPGQNKTRSFDNMVMSFSQQTRPECKIESSLRTGRQKKMNALVLMGCFLIATLCLEPWVAFTFSVPVK